MSKMKPAIVINNQTISNAVIRALAEKGGPVIAVHYRSYEFGYLSRYVTESMRVPDPGKAEEGLISKLMELSSRFKGSLLIPREDGLFEYLTAICFLTASYRFPVSDETLFPQSEGLMTGDQEVLFQ